MHGSNSFYLSKTYHVNKSLLFLALCIPASILAQDQIIVEVTHNSVDPLYSSLWEKKEVIRDDFVLNEKLLDMFHVWETDSILKKKRERHRVFGAAIIPLFGFYWSPITKRKEKYVGTVKGEARVPGEERFTEYDVNFNMVPHLPRYIALAYVGHIEEKRRDRHKTEQKVNRPPFTYPNSPKDLERLHLHNECTPSVEHRKLLDSLFYPTIRPNNLKDHPNFGEEGVTLGMYGAFVSDCNHNCHPEIHPYEWLWWMDLNPKKEHKPNEIAFYIGLLRDVSNRMRHWSSAPRTGLMSVPFSFPADANSYEISLEHLVTDIFYPEVLSEKIEAAASAYNLNFTEKVINLNGISKSITFKNEEKINHEGIKWWVSDVVLDEAQNLVTGKLNFVMSVRNLYTARVAFSYE